MFKFARQWKIRRLLIVVLFFQLFLIWIVEKNSAFFSPPATKNSIVHWVGDQRVSLLCDGRIFRSPEADAEHTILWVELAQCANPQDRLWKETDGKVYLSLRGRESALRLGDWVRFQSTFRLPHDFQNPGSFQLSQYYKMMGVVALGSISDPNLLMILSSSPATSLSRWLETKRKNISSAIFRASGGTASFEGGAFLASIIVGERKSLGKDWEDAFRKAGVSHILSISGLHVTMVAFLFLGVLRLLFSLPIFANKFFLVRYHPLLALIFVWFYVGVADFQVAAVRSAIMGSFFLIAWVSWRRLDLLSSLLLAAFLILAVSPLSLFGVSFQLSFVSVLFLILFFPRWREFRLSRKIPFILASVLDLLAISVIAVAGVAPFLLHHFHEISIVGLLANIVVVPLVNFLVMPVGMLSWVLTGLFGLDVLPLWRVAGIFSDWSLRAVDFFARHSSWGIFHGAVSFWQIVFYYGAVYSLGWSKSSLAKVGGTVSPSPQHPRLLYRSKFIQHKRRLAFASVLMAGIFLGDFMPKDSKLKITFVDVGQGDCAVIQLPSGKVWVVDGGGIRGSDWDIGRFVIAPFLWERGIRHIDTIFLSHPHHDHYKGLAYLAEQFHPKIMFVNGDHAPENEIQEWEEFLGRVSKAEVSLQTVNRSTPSIQEGEVSLKFFLPLTEGVFPNFDTNDNSAVMQLSYKDVKFLFMGDLMEAGEKVLLQHEKNLKSTFLKVGHHGSDTSTTQALLDAVAPRYAVMSLGAYNTYGMPGQVVLDRLKENGVQFYRTDQQGAVTVSTDGKELKFSSFVR